MKHKVRYYIARVLSSPPMRGRGLKRRNRCGTVAGQLSPPMRGRGLKPVLRAVRELVTWSPPMRGRGLKQVAYRRRSGLRRVAPHAGARIETRR